jgi:hypothetical protein
MSPSAPLTALPSTPDPLPQCGAGGAAVAVPPAKMAEVRRRGCLGRQYAPSVDKNEAEEIRHHDDSPRSPHARQAHAPAILHRPTDGSGMQLASSSWTGRLPGHPRKTRRRDRRSSRSASEHLTIHPFFRYVITKTALAESSRGSHSSPWLSSRMGNPRRNWSDPPRLGARKDARPCRVFPGP